MKLDVPELLRLEAHLDSLGWDQPHGVLAVVGANQPGATRVGCTELAIVPLAVSHTHPFEVLAMRTMGPECIALIVVSEGWSYPPDLLADQDALSRTHRWLSPSAHPRRVEQRTVMVVSRDGDDLAVSRPRGSEPIVLDREHAQIEGRVPDAMRRALGRDVPIPDVPVGALLGRIWARTVAHRCERAARDRLPPPPLELGDDPAVALAPLVDVPETEARSSIRSLVVHLDWQRVFELCCAGNFQHVGFRIDPRVACWMGPGMLARELLDQSPTTLQSLDTIEAVGSPELSGALERELAARGWSDIESSLSAPGGPGVAVPGRNERCPCNSGSKFKYCCGAWC